MANVYPGGRDPWAVLFDGPPHYLFGPFDSFEEAEAFARKHGGGTFPLFATDERDSFGGEPWIDQAKRLTTSPHSETAA